MHKQNRPEQSSGDGRAISFWHSRYRATIGLGVLAALAAGAGLLGVAAGRPATVWANDPTRPPFMAAPGYFLVLADLHVGSGTGDRNTRQVVAEVVGAGLRPDFVLLTGDITEMNRSSEWRQAAQILQPLADRTTVYALNGNHDSRWPNDMQNLAAATLRPRRVSVRWHGVQVLGLDSSVPLEQHGHVGIEQQRWLVDQLGQSGADGAVAAIVAAHHPIGWSSPFVGDQDEALEAIDQAQAAGGAPVCLILSGHGHAFSTQLADGRISQMIGAAMDGQYAVVAYEGDRLTVYGKQVGQAWNEVMSIALPGLPRPRVELVSPGRNAVTKGTQPIPLTVRVTPPEGQAFPLTDVAWRVDDGFWDSLTPGDDQLWRGVIDPTRQNDGVHRLQIQVEAGLRQFVMTTRLTTSAHESQLLWQVQTGGALQAAPVVDGATLWVASGNGQVLALDRLKGKILRIYPAAGPIVGGPAVDERHVYAGSLDGRLYAWDKETGQVAWRLVTGSPVYSTPLVDPELDAVYCAAGDGRMYAVRRSDGSALWSVLLGGVAEGRPLRVDDSLWLGTWAGTIHQIDRRTGQVLRRISNGRTYYTSGPCTPATDSGVIVFTNTDSKVYAYDRESGQLLWTLARACGYASPAVDARHHTVILSTLNGEVYAADIRQGAVLWSSPVGQPVYNSSPVVWHTPWGRTEALVGTTGGRVWRLDSETGKLLGSMQAGGDFLFARVTAVDGENLVYAASLDGNVYAFRVSGP